MLNRIPHTGLLVALLAVIFVIAGGPSRAYALGPLQVENAAVGQRTLIITFDDSVRAPDLSKIRVEGYEIENAVFVEEMSPEPIRFSKDFIDMTLPGRGRVIEFSAAAGTLILDLPSADVPVAGSIIADTAFGGLFRKVVEVGGQPQSGLTGRRWVLKTVEADFPEAVQDCDIAFKTRMDMNQSLADLSQTQEVMGSLADGTPAYGALALKLTGAQVLFQPVVAGRIRVRNGNVEVFQFQVNGECEVAANLRAAVSGGGDFEYEEELPGKAPMLVTLGSGLFLRMQNRPFLRVESHSKGDAFSAQGEFRIRNSIKGDLGFRDGQWRPLAENKMTWGSQNLLELKGNGEIRMSLKPRVEMLLQGLQGPVFTFEPFARFSSLPGQIPAPMAAEAAGFAPKPAWTANTWSLGAPAAVTFPMPRIPGSSAVYDPARFGTGNKEMNLGSNIYMETRTTFTGPSYIRNFLLFNREQSVLSPPREGTLALREADSNRINLLAQTFPKSDYYVIQQKVGAGPWETLIEKSVAPRFKISQLKPNSQYRFRALGVNGLGTSPAFPPEGIAFNTPAANRPPFSPAARFPDSGAVVSDSLPVVLAWKGGDPDLGAKVQYTVYLDTRFPPLAIRNSGLTDTALSLSDLKPGATYFWRVVSSDGLDRSEGAVRSFTLKAPEPAMQQVPKPFADAYPLVPVPKGTYHREDGRIITVGPFFIGKYEVTQAEFQKFTGRNPSYRLQDSLPVDRITWEEADAFCRETGGRLPSEAEWEYAARAGNAESFYWGAENAGDYAWYRDNSDNRTQKVGMKKPNSWGLYDMAGNVFEWVQDWYGDYNVVDLDHPKGPPDGTARVIRGASWYSESGSLSLTARYNNRPGFRNFKVGFRCAKDPERTSFNEPVPSPLAAKTTGSDSKFELPASK
ncbi:MAG: SUMF1/EgtB/PvdO family nonheme iron enzyme [Fibrobacteria bacterium]